MPENLIALFRYFVSCQLLRNKAKYVAKITSYYSPSFHSVIIVLSTAIIGFSPEYIMR